jgi:hypothetical protein
VNIYRSYGIYFQLGPTYISSNISTMSRCGEPAKDTVDTCAYHVLFCRSLAVDAENEEWTTLATLSWTLGWTTLGVLQLGKGGFPRCCTGRVHRGDYHSRANIAPLGPEFDGRITWKLQSDLGCFHTNDSPKWYNIRQDYCTTSSSWPNYYLPVKQCNPKTVP